MMPTTNGAISKAAPGAEIYEPVKPTADDILSSRSFATAAFTARSWRILLRAIGRDTIAITGVATNVCCDSTARDGAMRDFKVLVSVGLQCVFHSEAEQEATLNNFDKHFGVVMDSQTLHGQAGG